jgi:hypothetical protein
MMSEINFYFAYSIYVSIFVKYHCMTILYQFSRAHYVLPRRHQSKQKHNLYENKLTNSQQKKIKMHKNHS